VGLTRGVERHLLAVPEVFTVAVMGCVVKRPGQRPREADLGLAGGRGLGDHLRKGEVVRKVMENDLLPAFLNELDTLPRERRRTA
jgi:(E)-4-hydroxy-3-methylbut-2-enyl-diphosphate synthase